MKSGVLGRSTIGDKSGKLLPISIVFLFVVILAALLLGGIIGTLDPIKYGFVMGIIIMALVVLLRQDELAAILVVVVSLYVDWFLGLLIVAQMMALMLLVIFFLARSPQYPWAEPRSRWLWVLFLVLTIFPAIKGATTRFDTFYYYPNLILGALIMFWLGTVVARNVTSVRRFFKIFAGFGTLIAVHVIIQATTGRLLFATTQVEAYLVSRSYYQLGSFGVSRAGSFFVQPDAGSAFLAMMLFIPLGLFVESSSFLEKVFYLTETLLILIALLFTYSIGAWLAACVGMVVFVVLVGSMRYRIQISLYIIAAAAVLFVGFPSQVNLLFQHGSNPNELLLRQGLWQTAWRVIQAFPLTGIGLGRLVYLETVDPYRVPAAYVAENNPHNSYLEWGAMAGLPVLFVFLALLVFSLWQALRIWMRADREARTLLGAGIATITALSFNSWSFGAWTLPPLAAPGWLILGVISSPLLMESLSSEKKQEKSNHITSQS